MKFRIVLPVLVVIASGLLLAGCAPSEEAIRLAEEKVREADQLVVNQQYLDALNKYDEARSLDSGNVFVYTGIAGVYRVKNRVNDAKQALEAGISKSRNPSLAYEILGDILMSENDVASAKDNYLNAVHKESQNYSARYKYAVSLVNLRDFENARDELDIPQDGAPVDVYAKSELLKAILLRANIADAQAILSDIATLDLEDSVLKSNIAEYSDMLERLAALPDDESSDKYTDVMLASGAITCGFEDVALDLLDEYKDEVIEYWEMDYYLGQAYYMNMEFENAIVYLADAQTLNPADYRSPWLLGRVYKESGDQTRMVENYVRAIALAPLAEKKSIRLEYVAHLVPTELYVEADEQYTALMVEDAANANSYQLDKIVVMLERDLVEDASTALAAITQSSLVGTDLQKYNWLMAKVLYTQGDGEAARTWIDGAIELDDSVAEYHLLLGQILFEDGASEEARTELERAIDLDLEGRVSVEAANLLDRT